MKIEGKEYCDVTKVRVAPIAKSIAKDMIVTYHYTHAWTMCRYAFGIFYMGDERDVFGNNEKLIGCAIYGFPVGAKAATSICEGLSKDNALELTRLFVHDGYGSNIESYALGQTFKWFKENDKNIKVLLSYADNGQGHLGGIYKATNWRYEGYSSQMALMPNYDISLTGPEGTFIHSRTVFSKWGSNNLDHLKREIGKEGYTEFWRRRSPDKHRYIQLLPQNKKEKKDLLGRMKQQEYPYPSSTADYDYPIEHHLTYPPEDYIENKFW
jgi:hypothetical protein